MKIELNYREYTYALCSKYTKCNTCAWEPLPQYYCAKFCRTGWIFKTTRIAPLIFHL